MYAKIFRQIYDGTLADNWEAMVTFQQLMILSDETGVVDMTVSAISRTTGIPRDILERGIASLEAPDPSSRTPDMEGRRIVRIDEHRDWGWFLVNRKKYRDLVNKEEKKEADRKRIAEKRAQSAEKNPTESDMSKGVAECSDVSQPVAGCSGESPAVANVAQAEAEAETETEESKAQPPDGGLFAAGEKPPTDEPPPCPHQEIVSAYHQLLPTLRRVRDWTPERQAMLRSRWRQAKERQSLDWWRKVFGWVGQSAFLMGREAGSDGRYFDCDLEWIIRPKNLVKILEGKYHKNRRMAA